MVLRVTPGLIASKVLGGHLRHSAPLWSGRRATPHRQLITGELGADMPATELSLCRDQRCPRHRVTLGAARAEGGGRSSRTAGGHSPRQAPSSWSRCNLGGQWLETQNCGLQGATPYAPTHVTATLDTYTEATLCQLSLKGTQRIKRNHMWPWRQVHPQGRRPKRLQRPERPGAHAGRTRHGVSQREGRVKRRKRRHSHRRDVHTYTCTHTCTRTHCVYFFMTATMSVGHIFPCSFLLC